MRTLTIVAALMLWSGVAEAEVAIKGFLSGNKLLEHCEKGGASFAEGYCWGYVIGLADRSISAENIERKSDPSPCISAGATVRQMVRVTVKYLRENPGKLHLDAAQLVWKGLARAFPCH